MKDLKEDALNMATHRPLCWFWPSWSDLMDWKTGWLLIFEALKGIILSSMCNTCLYHCIFCLSNSLMLFHFQILANTLVSDLSLPLNFLILPGNTISVPCNLYIIYSHFHFPLECSMIFQEFIVRSRKTALFLTVCRTFQNAVYAAYWHHCRGWPCMLPQPMRPLQDFIPTAQVILKGLPQG
jgi:hypothetical protein